MSEPSKPYFAPIPNRALIDDRMKGRHYRVLGIIAAHDRFMYRGLGCTLSGSRIAAKVGMTQPNVSRACRDLEAWGYLARHAHPKIKQRSMWTVLYDPQSDKAVLGTPPEAASLPPANPEPDDKPMPHRAMADGQTYAPQDIHNRLNLSSKINSGGESASPNGDDGLRDGESDKPLCARLAMFERALKAGRYRFKLDALQEFYILLDDITAEYENGTPEHGMAYRLMDDVDDQIQEAVEAERTRFR